MSARMKEKSDITPDLDQLCINTIRALAIDAVQKAESGHPGLPLGAAPMAYVLWTRFLRHNPRNPKWENRDRFLLSAGHGSMLLYSLLYLTGYDLSLDEIKNFRQWGSLRVPWARGLPMGSAWRWAPRIWRLNSTRMNFPSSITTSMPSSLTAT